MKRVFALLIREPLVGFMLAGGLVFLLYAHLSASHQQSIALTEDQITDLVQMREELLGRRLNENEKQLVINEYVDSEILLREAVVLGLHLHDGNVRKRLVEKMNFLLGVEPPTPQQEDLKRLLKEQPDNYMTPASISFEHVYIKDDREKAEQILADISTGQVLADEAGDLFWLGRQLDYYNNQQLLVLFGRDFTKAVNQAPEGEWTGPIQSGGGWHLVRVIKYHPPEPLPEAELKRQLQVDWEEQYRTSQREKRLAELRPQYRIQLPDQTADESS